MVEETKEPERIFPRMMLTGLGIAVIIYMLVAVSVVAVIPADKIATPTNAEAGILIDVVKLGAPDLPIDDFSKKYIDITLGELEEERAGVADLL